MSEVVRRWFQEESTGGTPIVLNGNTYSSVILILSGIVCHSFTPMKPPCCPKIYVSVHEELRERCEQVRSAWLWTPRSLDYSLRTLTICNYREHGNVAFCSKGPLLRFSRLSSEFRKTKLKPCTNRRNDHNDLFAIRHNGGTTVSRRIPIPLSGRHKYIEAHWLRELMNIISHVDQTRGMYSICRRLVSRIKKKYGENVHTTDSVKWYRKWIALAGWCIIVWIGPERVGRKDELSKCSWRRKERSQNIPIMHTTVALLPNVAILSETEIWYNVPTKRNADLFSQPSAPNRYNGAIRTLKTIMCA